MGSGAGCVREQSDEETNVKRSFHGGGGPRLGKAIWKLGSPLATQYLFPFICLRSYLYVDR